MFLVLLIENICRHSEAEGYRKDDDKNYYTKTYYNRQEDVVQFCMGCKSEFGTDYKVSFLTPVYRCERASCLHAFCSTCFHNKVDNQSKPSNKRASRRAVKKV